MDYYNLFYSLTDGACSSTSQSAGQYKTRHTLHVAVTHQMAPC